MSVIDRLIEAISPVRAIHRARARAHLEMIKRAGYTGAKNDRRFTGLFSGERTADQDTIEDLPTLRGRMRELARNNAWVRNATRRIVARTVGCGITGKVIGTDARSKRLQANWKAWAEGPVEHNGKRNLYAMQRLWLRTVIESGEVIRRAIITRNGLRFVTYEPDHLDRTKDRDASGGQTRITHGKEFTAAGEFLGAWIIPEPNSYLRTLVSESVYVPAAELDICHDLERVAQSMGVPWGSASIQRIYDMQGFEDAHLFRNKLANCMAAFIHGTSETAREITDKISPGAIQILKGDEEVTFSSPPDPNDLPPYMRYQQSAVAADFGISYEGISGDYSQVNFSSGRMGGITENQNVHVWRWQMFIPQLLDTAFARWMSFQPGTAVIEWSPEAVPLQDPSREIPTAITAIRGGLTSLPAWLRENGQDPELAMQQIKESNDLLDRLGLVLDCDPRRVTNGGQFQVPPNAGGQPNG